MTCKTCSLLAVVFSILAAATEMAPEESLTLVHVTPPPYEWTGTKASYVSPSTADALYIQIGCRVPPHPDIELKWEWTFLEGNPFFPEANVSVQTKSQFVIQSPNARDVFLIYDTNKLVKMVQVTCTAFNVSSHTKIGRKTMSVEILYFTKNAVVQDDQKQVVNDLAMAPGKTQRLFCVADGNPAPRIRWYNETKDGSFRYSTNDSQLVVKQDNEYSLKKIQCWAQNHNQPETQWVHSLWVTASSPINANICIWLLLFSTAITSAILLLDPHG